MNPLCAVLITLLLPRPAAFAADEEWGSYDSGNISAPSAPRPEAPPAQDDEDGPRAPEAAPAKPGPRAEQESRLRKMATTTPQERRRLSQAQGLLDAGRAEQAVAVVEEVLEENPEDPNVLRLYAVAADAAGLAPEALAAVLRGRELVPENEAFQDLEKLLTRKVPAADASARAWAIFAGSDSPPPARTPRGAAGGVVRSMATELSRPVEREQLARGLSGLRIGDASGAERRFSRRIEADPGDAAAFRLRGLARRRLHDLKGALSDMDTAVRLGPKDGWNYKGRALVCGDLGRFAQARADLARALELDPADAGAYYVRSQVWGLEGVRAERLKDLRTAALLDEAFESAYRAALSENDPPAAPARRRDRTLLFGASLSGLGLMALGLLKGGARTALTRTPALESVVGFEVVRRLGQGETGEVWEADDRVLQRRVLIKRMPAEVSKDPRERRRFLKEARTVAALKHPNIVEVHSVLEALDGLYLVFEFVEGESLRELVARRGRLSFGELRPYLEQVAAALDHAHGAGVVHQHLKPANIMIAGPWAKVTDFGISRAPSQTGTPDYMAPEQELGQSSPRSDIYALGICLYEALSGGSPFKGAAGTQLKRRKAYIPLAQVLPDLPPGFDAALDKTLEPDPALRFASAGELLRALTGPASEAPAFEARLLSMPRIPSGGGSPARCG